MEVETSTDYTVPTGEYIEEWLEDHGYTQTDLALRAGISRKHLNRVIAGAPVTPHLAERLEIATGVPARRWLALEATYRADLERLRHVEELAENVELAKNLSRLAGSLRKLKIISDQATLRRPGQMILEIMAFFRVSTVDLLEDRLMRRPEVAFKQTTAHEIDWPSVNGWLRLGEIQAMEDAMEAPLHDASTLHDSLPRLRGMSLDPQNGITNAALELRSSGVMLTFVPELKGSRCYGATQWLGQRPVVQLSARGKTDAWIWFTMFHELGHVLLHPGQTIVEQGGGGPIEDDADAFAQDALVPPDHREALRAASSRAEVRSLAASLGVSPGIIVGYIHHEGWKPHEWWRDLFVSYEFDDAD